MLLQVGDQLVSVNGYRVDDAVHSELVHYLASQTRLKIKVRRKPFYCVSYKIEKKSSLLY
jgi:type II secretory pathway component PulC